MSSIASLEFFSQMGQDRILYEKYFKHMKTPGIFVDVGAHDGKTLSNTYFLEKSLGWTGICVEPNPTIYKELIKARSCICVDYAISDHEETMDFLQLEGQSEMLSGLYSKYDVRHLKVIQSYLQNTGGTMNLIEVKTVPLQTLLDKHSMNNVTYLSIDVEGAEFDVLRGIDYTKTFVDIIELENNYGKYTNTFAEITAFLKSKGFEKKLTIEWDEVFVNTNSVFYEM